MAVIEDIVTGRLHHLRIPGELEPVRLRLSPDGQQVAIQLATKGKWRVEMFNLNQLLEADKRDGIRLTTPTEGL